MILCNVADINLVHIVLDSVTIKTRQPRRILGPPPQQDKGAATVATIILN